MTDLAALLKAATPEPPVEVSLADLHPHRRRSFAPLAAAVLVLVLAVTAFVLTTHRRGASPASRRPTGPATIFGLHFPHTAGWATEAFPGSMAFVTNVVPAHCRVVDETGCDPTSRRLGRGQVLISVTTGARATRHVSAPNRVVAGLPAHVGAADAGCTRAELPGYDVQVCAGPGVDVSSILAGVYLHRPAPTDLGIVTGRLLKVGGPAPGAAGPVSGIVRVGTHAVPAGSDGFFAVAVSPGSYVVTGSSPQIRSGNGRETCSAGKAVRVRAGEVVQSDVTCPID